MNLYPFQLHLGTPRHPTATCSLIGRSHTRIETTEHWVEHPVKNWWGLSYKSRWFIGFTTYDDQRQYPVKVAPELSSAVAPNVNTD